MTPYEVLFANGVRGIHGKLIQRRRRKKVQEIRKEKLKLSKELKEKRRKDAQRGLYYVLKISTTLKF